MPTRHGASDEKNANSLTTTDLPPNHHTTGGIDAVNLKYVLRQIEPDDRYPFHDLLLT